jgi:hypothetical protein
MIEGTKINKTIVRKPQFAGIKDPMSPDVSNHSVKFDTRNRKIGRKRSVYFLSYTRAIALWLILP